MSTSRRACRTVARLAVVASALAVLGCAGRGGQGTATAEPPAAVLRSSFEQASLAAEVEVRAVTAEKAFPDDEGRPGYVRYLVEAVVVACHKGELAVAQPLSYRFTREEDAGAATYPRIGARMLVFLKRDAEDGRLWLVAEGGQLEATPRLQRLAARLARRR